MMQTDRSRQHSGFEAIRLPQFAPQDASRPFVVALEGPNGVGKSTLCRALCDRLHAPCCLGTDAAWFSEAFKVRMIRDAEWHASAMFFLSGCFEQMRLLRDRPDRLIIMDRSLWSTFAVQAAEDTKRLEALAGMLRPVAEWVRIPSLTLVLEATFATCTARIAQKTGTARALDALTATAAFHAREQGFYRWLGHEIPSVTFLNVDDLNPGEAAEKAGTLILQKAPC